MSDVAWISRRTAAPIGSAVAVALVAFAWLNYVNPPFFINDDGIRDQLLVRDCTDLGRCHLLGSPMSVPGFRNGAAWVDLLIAVRLLGGDTSTDRTVVLSLLALSVATLFVVVWRWLRASIALPAAVLFLGALGLDAIPSMLANGSVSAFPDTLTAAGLLCYALSGQYRFITVSAFALAVAIDVHVGSLSLGPSLVAIAVLARAWSWRGLLVSVAILVATYFIPSSAALRANVIGLAGHGRLIAALAAGFAVVVLSASLGSRFRRLSWDTRAWIVGLILILPFVLASLWLVAWEGHHFAFYYLHPILAPGAVLAAAVLVLPFELGARWTSAVRWIPTAAALAAMAFVPLHVWRATPALARPKSNGWDVAEAAAIADHVVKLGWSYEDLVFRIQGNACRELLVGMSIAAPPPNSAVRQGRRQLQVVKGTPDELSALADVHDVVPLGPTTAAVLRAVDSWLQPEALRVCRVPIASASPPQCAPARAEAADARSLERFLFITRSFPEIHGIELLPPYIAKYEIPLSPVVDQTRDLVVIDDAVPDCGWRITRVEGVDAEGPLPAERVRLHSDTGSGGVVVIEKPCGTAACPSGDMRYPPCVFESVPGDPVQALVARR